MNFVDFLSAQPESRKAALSQFYNMLAGGPLPHKDIQEALGDRADEFADLKRTLYEAGLITQGRRNGKIRQKTAEERGDQGAFQLPPVAQAVQATGLDNENVLTPSLDAWLREQEWFDYLYSDAFTSVAAANLNPDILGVSLPAYMGLPGYEVEVLAVEVKKSLSEFMQDKLLAEVTTYTTFAHYVFAAYYKPWDSLFRPPDEEELLRMQLLQKLGVGVFWVSCQRMDAAERNYRCMMVQNAICGKPDLYETAYVLDKFRAHLRNGTGQTLPNLAREAHQFVARQL